MKSATYTGDFDILWKKEREIKARWGNLIFCIAFLLGYPATSLLYLLRNNPAFAEILTVELVFSFVSLVLLFLHLSGRISSQRSSFLTYLALIPIHAYILATVPHDYYGRATFNMTLALIFTFFMVRWPVWKAVVATALILISFPIALYARHPEFFFQFLREGGLFFFMGQLLFPFIMLLNEKRDKREFFYRYTLATQNEKLEKQKQIAENATIAKSEFLSTMSHEIRTPLNGIVGIVHLLQENKSRDGQEQELIETLKFSAAHLMAVVNDILDFNKINSNHVKLHSESFDPELLFKNLYNTFVPKAREKNLELLFNIPESLPQLTGDQTRLSQVITNLVHNAIKFTDRGFVSFSVAEVSRTDSIITLAFKVSDSGIGISESQQSNVFQIFTQVKSLVKRQDSGTGLGLAISRELVRLFGGEIKLESRLGSGSSFSFQIELPYSVKKAPQVPVEKLPTAHFNLNSRILLVDDNATNLMLATRLLERKKIPFDLAANGKQAVDLYLEKGHELIFMDLRMPVMDGFEATKQIRTLNPDVPIVALTASAFEDERERALSSGFSDYLVKPFLPPDFYKIIALHIGVENGGLP
ncbi:response regulator [Dyadobacter sp. Leaf189]|uniref:response regulator n=1 Tax=Dyadobacter sp. Leaf189 TaxID=1736295 RepID=UPI00138F05A8|nr:response regulator [Dyadobacter sp. Leaf189]